MLRKSLSLSCVLLIGPLHAGSVETTHADRAADRAAAPLYTHTLYLIRHGAYNPQAAADSEHGPGLIPLGIEQAQLIAKRIAAMSIHFDSLTSSTMTRAEETAAVIHKALPNVPLSDSSQLAECTPPAFEKLKDVSATDEHLCAQRLEAVFAERFVPARGAEKNDIIVAHGNVIRYLVTKAIHADTHAWLGMSIAHASLTVIRIRPDGTLRVLSVGDVGHIPPQIQSW